MGELLLKKALLCRARVERIRRALPADPTDVERDEKLEAFLSFHLFLLAQDAVDLAAHLVAARGLDVPGSQRETFDALAAAGLLGRDTAEGMAGLASLRNRIAHAYGDVDAVRMVREAPAGDEEDRRGERDERLPRTARQGVERRAGAQALLGAEERGGADLQRVDEAVRRAHGERAALERLIRVEARDGADLARVAEARGGVRVGMSHALRSASRNACIVEKRSSRFLAIARRTTAASAGGTSGRISPSGAGSPKHTLNRIAEARSASNAARPASTS